MPRLSKTEKHHLQSLLRNKPALTFNNWQMTRTLREKHLIAFNEQGKPELTPKARFLIEVGFL